MLAQVLQRYQRYDALTNAFTSERSVVEYAELLGVDHSSLYLIYTGKRQPGMKVLHSLVRLFPSAATEIAAALQAQPQPVTA